MFGAVKNPSLIYGLFLVYSDSHELEAPGQLVETQVVSVAPKSGFLGRRRYITRNSSKSAHNSELYNNMIALSIGPFSGEFAADYCQEILQGMRTPSSDISNPLPRLQLL